MGTYVYTGEDARTYESRSLEVRRGDEAEWDEAPDYRWSEAGSPEAEAALAEKAEREAADAPAEKIRPDVPAGSLPTDSVPDINAYLSKLKDEDAELYEVERERLLTGQTRKGLIEGPHALDPVSGNDDVNPEGV